MQLLKALLLLKLREQARLLVRVILGRQTDIQIILKSERRHLKLEELLLVRGVFDVEEVHAFVDRSGIKQEETRLWA